MRPNPPINMNTINSPDICQLNKEGLTKRFKSTYRDPAIPVIAPDKTKAINCILKGFIPTDLTLVKLNLVALKAKPNLEQFWLSYIDALIMAKQSEKAKQVLKNARIQGIAEEN